MATVATAVIGSTAKPVGVLYVPPERQVVDAGSGTELSSSGLDPDFMADLLSACLAHERCGVHLYRSVAGRSRVPEFVEQYQHFGEETLEHVRLLEQLITGAGGNPAYVSPSARATEKAASGLLESTFMLEGSLDPETAELAMLEAVMLAEAKDRANWEMITQLAGHMREGSMRAELERASDEVLSQEIEHHSWARDARAAMLISRATGSPAQSMELEQEVADFRTKADLYEEAQKLGIEGRSSMTKEELAHAVAEQGGRS